MLEKLSPNSSQRTRLLGGSTRSTLFLLSFAPDTTWGVGVPRSHTRGMLTSCHAMLEVAVTGLTMGGRRTLDWHSVWQVCHFYLGLDRTHLLRHESLIFIGHSFAGHQSWLKAIWPSGWLLCWQMSLCSHSECHQVIAHACAQQSGTIQRSLGTLGEEGRDWLHLI